MQRYAAIKFLVAVCCLIGLGALYPPPSYAVTAYNGTLVDDFNGPYLNTRLWRPFIEKSPHARIAQQGGELRIQIDGNSYGAAGVTSKFLLKGDFDATVDYRLITWPDANGVRLGFEGPGADSDQVFLVKRISWGPYDLPNIGEVYLAAFESGVEWYGNQAPTVDKAGSLRLTRVGNVLTGYFFNQSTSAWQQIASHDYGTSGYREWVEITLWAVGPSNAPASQDVEIAFDNFQVTYDQVRFLSDLSPMTLLLLD
jgi:hypothetical protein